MSKLAVELITIAGLACFAFGAQAKSLYVDSARGDDSVSYAANSQATPWRTLGRAVWGSANRDSTSAAEAARAGDTVLVSGAHSAPATNTRYVPAFNPANSGTQASPLVIRAVGRVELRTTSGRGPIIGTNERNHVHWLGAFVLDENQSQVHPDTGLVTMWFSDGIIIDGCEIRGILQTYGDNHNGVRFEQTRNSTVRNCRISGILGTPPGGNAYHHNNAGVMLYGNQNIVIENNTISNCGAGVFPKGSDNFNITIRYNRISGCSRGVRTTYSSPTQGQNRIYQNIVENGATDDNIGVLIAENSYNWTITNNTFVNVHNGVYLVWPENSGNIQISNNLASNVRTGLNAYEWRPMAPVTGGQLYHSVQGWALNGQEFSSFTSWRVAVPGEATSTVADPRFVNAVGGDYHLGASSPALQLGREVLDLNGNGSIGDVIPAGAYVRGNEVIGINTGPVPNPPTSLTVDP